MAGPLFSTYLLGFEVASVVLLAAAVGGVVLGAARPGMRAPGEREPFPERVGADPASRAADAGDGPRDAHRGAPAPGGEEERP